MVILGRKLDKGGVGGKKNLRRLKQQSKIPSHLILSTKLENMLIPRLETTFQSRHWGWNESQLGKLGYKMSLHHSELGRISLVSASLKKPCILFLPGSLFPPFIFFFNLFLGSDCHSCVNLSLWRELVLCDINNCVTHFFRLYHVVNNPFT